MPEIRFFKEEIDTNEQEILKLENLLSCQLPLEYRNFLLKYNGCRVFPDCPKIKNDTDEELWNIDRILSVGDLILQQQYDMHYTLNNQYDDEDLNRYDLELSKFICIARAERGNYYMNLKQDDFGRIYFINDTFAKLDTTSFNEFINSLDFLDWYSVENKILTKEREANYLRIGKPTQRNLFHTPNQPELGLQRLIEVLKFGGDLNEYIGYYINDRLILNFFLDNGVKNNGLLQSFDFDTIYYLVKIHNIDINKKIEPFFYPLQYYTISSTSPSFYTKQRYDLMDKLLNSDLYLDLTITDDEGNNIIDRLRKLAQEYGRYYKENYEMYKNKRIFPPSELIISEKINELIK